MNFQDHKLTGAPFNEARWTGGQIAPEIVVLHDTAGRLDPGNAANYLRDNDRKVSVHFVVERDGLLEQQVPVNLRANHAGKSQYHGRKNVNGFSVGIEIVNPGRLKRFDDNSAQAWFGKKYNIREYGIQEIETPEHGAGLWMPYTEAQIETVTRLLAALFEYLPSLTDVVPHWYISPGRKSDTNPHFPLEQVRSMIFGREDPRDTLADASSAGVDDGSFVEIETRGGGLNMRAAPAINPNILTTIPDGTAVPVLRRGAFEGHDWLKVFYAGQEGWIVSRYAAPVIQKL
jgi:N-acetylmuramoyl-L-alanine amidase